MKDDKRNGRGILRFADGNVYEGEFKDGLYNGRGIMRFANGDALDGTWINN